MLYFAPGTAGVAERRSPPHRARLLRRRPVGRGRRPPSPVENPADESVVDRARRHPARRGRPGDRRGPAELRRGDWADLSRPGSGRRSCTPSSTTSNRCTSRWWPPWWPKPASRSCSPRWRSTPPGMVLRPRTPSTSTCPWPHEEANPGPASTSWCGDGWPLSLRRHEPVGVVTAITPYNGAIIMAFQKLIPALMAGNSVDPAAEPADPDLVAGLRARRRGRRPAGRRAERGRRAGGRRGRAAHHRPRGRHGLLHRARPRWGGRSWPRRRRP